MHTLIIKNPTPLHLLTAIQTLSTGGLVAFPTDTVYGLAADLNSEEAIERLFEAKGREASKAIAVLVGSVDQLDRLTPGLGDTARRLAERFWPGPLTLVVPRRADLPSNLSPYPTVGVRMPDHPLALALLRESGPLATTSANLSGQANPLTAQDVYDQLGGRIELILDGGTTPGGAPSTVVDCVGSELKILREGPISLEMLLESGSQD